MEFNNTQIYGVLCMIATEDYELIHKYEKIQDTLLTKEDGAEIKAEYNKIKTSDPDFITCILFCKYDICPITKEGSMGWWVGRKKPLQKFFVTGDITL